MTRRRVRPAVGVGLTACAIACTAARGVVPREASPPSPRCPPHMVVVPSDGMTAWADRGRGNSGSADATEPGSPRGAGTKSASWFCLDASEVVVADYAACVAGARCTEPASQSTTARLDRFRAFCNWRRSDAAADARDRHPVNCVSYEQAKAYCAWRGARLPTDVEWSWAASNGGQSIYPWGSAAPDGTRVNGCGRECPRAVRAATGDRELVARYLEDDGFAGTAPVGSFPRGDDRWGIHDLAGNVAELVTPVVARESTGDLTAGGGFLTQDLRMMSARMQTRTAWSGATSADLGFRCAADGL